MVKIILQKYIHLLMCVISINLIYQSSGKANSFVISLAELIFLEKFRLNAKFVPYF